MLNIGGFILVVVLYYCLNRTIPYHIWILLRICKTCSHPSISEINTKLLATPSINRAQVAREYGLSNAGIRSHVRYGHISGRREKGGNTNKDIKSKSLEVVSRLIDNVKIITGMLSKLETATFVDASGKVDAGAFQSLKALLSEIRYTVTALGELKKELGYEPELTRERVFQLFIDIFSQLPGEYRIQAETIINNRLGVGGIDDKTNRGS